MYIRFGEIPPTGRSRIHRGDAIIGEELGVSVWDCLYKNGRYHIVVPNPITMNTLPDIEARLEKADYFQDVPVYLVNGVEVGTGSDGEPVLTDVVIMKKLADRAQDIFMKED